MLIFFISNNNYAAKPFFLRNKLSDVCLRITASLNTNNSGILIKCRSLRRERRWRRVLEQEFTNTTSDTIHAELSFLYFISWSEENNCAILRNIVLGSKFLSDTAYSLFEVSSEEFAINEKRFFIQQMLEFSILRIKVANSIISSILACILSWETEAIRRNTLNRDSVVNKVDIAASPLFVVLDELIVEMASGKIISAMLIKAYRTN